MVVGIWFAPAAMLPLSLVMLGGLRLANAAILRAGMGRGRIDRKSTRLNSSHWE